ncbi:MAG TPA: TRAP transporter small permease [Devosiaceae bacterium]|jgi:TRAP-type C4-dicarboxylate transport system permease small subunit|nr:TRAP transporter small permease [Devosiaceae bacterium]
MTRGHLAARLQRGAELIAAAMFAALFGTFLIQIFTRYVLNDPTAWTQELTLVLYIWIVFWTCSFVLHERDHITFDLISTSLPPRGRRLLALAATVLVVVAFGIALAPAFDYISFMKIVRTPVLRLPFDLVYSIFIVFLISVMAAGIWRAARLLGRHWQNEVVPHKPGEAESLL